MSYTVVPSDNSKYLICSVEGPITEDVALGFTKELDRLSRAMNIKRFLNDVRNASNAMSTLQNYIYAYQHMPDLELQRDARSAILIAPDDKSHDFVETVTRNAGYNVRVFDDEAKAIAWLED